MSISQEAINAVEGYENFTPERLEAIEQAWRDKADFIRTGADFFGVTVSAALSRASFARMAAAKMREDNIAVCRNIGPFQNDRFERGSAVKIAKGVEISTTHPKGKRVSARAATVKVHRVIPGYIYDNDIVDPVVQWSGASGYWFWTKLDHVTDRQAA
jgi:hypothetical protein